MLQELVDILMDQPEQEEEEDKNAPDFVNFEDVYFEDVCFPFNLKWTLRT